MFHPCTDPTGIPPIGKNTIDYDGYLFILCSSCGLVSEEWIGSQRQDPNILTHSCCGRTEEIGVIRKRPFISLGELKTITGGYWRAPQVDETIKELIT